VILFPETARWYDRGTYLLRNLRVFLATREGKGQLKPEGRGYLQAAEVTFSGAWKTKTKSQENATAWPRKLC